MGSAYRISQKSHKPPQEGGAVFQPGKLRLGGGTQQIQRPRTSEWQNQDLNLSVEAWVCATVHISSSRSQFLNCLSGPPIFTIKISSYRKVERIGKRTSTLPYLLSLFRWTLKAIMCSFLKMVRSFHRPSCGPTQLPPHTQRWTISPLVPRFFFSLTRSGPHTVLGWFCLLNPF